MCHSFVNALTRSAYTIFGHVVFLRCFRTRPGAFTLGSIGDVAFASRQMLTSVCDNNLPTLVLARWSSWIPHPFLFEWDSSLIFFELHYPTAIANVALDIVLQAGYSHSESAWSRSRPQCQVWSWIFTAQCLRNIQEIHHSIIIALLEDLRFEHDFLHFAS